MLKACAFDLGNTLINDYQLTQRTVAEMGRWLGARGLVKADTLFGCVYHRVNKRTKRPFISHTFGELSFFEETFRELEIDSITPLEALERYRELLLENIELDEGVMKALTWLKEKKLTLVIISNESVARVGAFLERTPLGGLFDEVLVSEAAGYEKPDLRIFQQALALLKIKSSEMVMFGDNEIADGACRELGILFVLITAFKRQDWVWEEGNSHTPDYVMKTLNENTMRDFFNEVGGGEP